MLKSLRLIGLGPVKDLSANFGQRLNIVTGDNGLGKSFLLDVCFWCLTGSWPGGRVAIPSGKAKSATIHYEIQSKTKDAEREGKFDFKSQTWNRQRGRPPMPGLVVYASVDGSFSVWDPARNYWRDPTNPAGEQLPRAFDFRPESTVETDEYGIRPMRRDVANGLEDAGRVLCNGLIADWGEWFYQKASAPQTSPFRYLEEVIALLSHPLEPLVCEEPKKVFLDDSRKFPSLRMPYGSVPYPHWSAGIKRVVSFAYLIVWAWVAHVEAAKLRKEDPTERIVVIVDEIEVHLHPKWQRTILPAILRISELLGKKVTMQVLTASHSPLVMASAEPHFSQKTDKLFWFDSKESTGTVEFHDYGWTTYGDVVGWLTSPIFGLRQARSREAEAAIDAAEAYMRGDTQKLPAGLHSKEAIHKALVQTLAGLDPFWPRWIVEAKS